ncbi:GNAT family N-acetyltransferase [Vibrio agarilyticus]|nr:GNAT family N-acetyltransferase [Vibrio agarilyticus]
MAAADLTKVAQIHAQAFVRQGHSQEWIECLFNGFPHHLIYVAERENALMGFIVWSQRSGFRQEVVLELEQLAVAQEYQRQGVARQLITASLPLIKVQLAKREASLKHVIVNTRVDNFAQQLYRDALGAEIAATISDLYSADEVFMIARNIG